MYKDAQPANGIVMGGLHGEGGEVKSGKNLVFKQSQRHVGLACSLALAKRRINSTVAGTFRHTCSHDFFREYVYARRDLG